MTFTTSTCDGSPDGHPSGGFIAGSAERHGGDQPPARHRPPFSSPGRRRRRASPRRRSPHPGLPSPANRAAGSAARRARGRPLSMKVQAKPAVARGFGRTGDPARVGGMATVSASSRPPPRVAYGSGLRPPAESARNVRLLREASDRRQGGAGLTFSRSRRPTPQEWPGRRERRPGPCLAPGGRNAQDKISTAGSSA